LGRPGKVIIRIYGKRKEGTLEGGFKEKAENLFKVFILKKD